MTRDFQISGPALVRVKGHTGSSIPVATDLGLSDGPIQPQFTYNHNNLSVDAFGGQAGVPPDVQWMGAEASITMTLVHFDQAVLAECMRLSMANASAEGVMRRAGRRMGNNLARFAVGNSYISLSITSPDAGLPWRFLTAFLTGTPMQYPLGVERTGVILQWRAIPYQADPYGGGTGQEGAVLWDHNLDT